MGRRVTANDRREKKRDSNHYPRLFCIFVVEEEDEDEKTASITPKPE